MKTRVRRSLVSVLTILLVQAVVSASFLFASAREIELWDAPSIKRRPEAAKWMMEEFLPEFEKETGIAVNYSVHWLDKDTSKQLESGEGPDILITFVDNLTGLEPYLVPLTPNLLRWPDRNAISPQFLRFTWRQFSSGDFADFSYLGLPFEVRPFGIVYYKKAYINAGLDPNVPPQGWEELELAAQKLTLERFGTVRKGFDTAWHDPGFLYAFLQTNGEVGVSQNLRRARLDTDAAVEAFDFLGRLYQLAYPQRKNRTVGLQTGNPTEMALGSMAMTWTDPLTATYIHNNSSVWGDVGMFLPRRSAGMEPKTSAYWNAICITTSSDDPAAAWEFIQWFFEPENTVRFHAKTNSIPSRKDVGMLFTKAAPNLTEWYSALDYADVEHPTGLRKFMYEEENLQLLYQGLSGQINLRGVLANINGQYQQYLDDVWSRTD